MDKTAFDMCNGKSEYMMIPFVSENPDGHIEYVKHVLKIVHSDRLHARLKMVLLIFLPWTLWVYNLFRSRFDGSY